jgi:hypothetical protein
VVVDIERLWLWFPGCFFRVFPGCFFRVFPGCLFRDLSLVIGNTAPACQPLRFIVLLGGVRFLLGRLLVLGPVFPRLSCAVEVFFLFFLVVLVVCAASISIAVLENVLVCGVLGIYDLIASVQTLSTAVPASAVETASGYSVIHSRY